MHEPCTGWGCARPSMPQVTSPANTPVPALLNHGVNALNTVGTLPAMMENVLFAGLSVLTPAKTALKTLYRHSPKY